MTATARFGAILVPTDFSPPSLRALDVAASLRPPDGEITLLHVIDTELAARAHKLGLASRDEVIAKMRARADEECAWLSKERATDFEVMVVEGVPFVEILKIASDLDVDLITIGSRGAVAPIKELLFGGTAEKVLRGALCPVLCVP